MYEVSAQKVFYRKKVPFATSINNCEKWTEHKNQSYTSNSSVPPFVLNKNKIC